MKNTRVVIDTNVFLTALKSRNGASFRLLSLIDSNKFVVSVSTTLILEYEDVAKRGRIPNLTHSDIDDIIDYICYSCERRDVFYLWRPFLRDTGDDFVLELAVESQSDFIITYNVKDFKEVEKYFGIEIITPKEFLKKIGEIK